jgi:uncharacterized protein (DUF736 family)
MLSFVAVTIVSAGSVLTLHDPKNSFGIATDDCADPSLRVQYNVFLDVRQSWAKFSCANGDYKESSLDELESNPQITANAGPSKRSDNKRYAATCRAGDTICTGCGGATAQPS